MFGFSLNSRKSGLNRPRVSTSGYVSKKFRTFHKVTRSRLADLKIKKLKKRSETKMWWGVRAYQEWRLNRLNDIGTYDENIFNANLDDLKSVTKVNLVKSLCRFIVEVKKVSGEEYPGKTLYQLAISIQKYLHEKGLKWKLIDESEFEEFHTVLDNIMKERAQQGIGNVKKQANLISMNFEEELWGKGILGEDSPEKLRNTVLFLLGINCSLRAGDEHHDLRRDTKDKPSQLSFQRNDAGIRCLVYTEDTVTKTNDGGLGHMRKERKVVWVYPSENINRCPVRLVDKYISLCPEVGPKAKCNFYLRPLEKINPAQWFSSRVMGVNAIRKVVGTMLKDVKLDGYFTNHSLRRSGTTRLFQAGVDRKLVKEFTGHSSDAVDQYQITSDGQRQEMSAIIRGKYCDITKKSDQLVETSKNQTDIDESGIEAKKPCEISSFEIKLAGDGPNKMACTCRKKNVKLSESEEIGQLVNKLLEGRTNGKATIKLEIDFHD